MISISRNRTATSGGIKLQQKGRKPGKGSNLLSGYTTSPDVEFNIDEFESYALSRLNVLRWIEKQSGLGHPIQDNLHTIILQNNLHIPQNDEISHFIGRLCFCQTLERRRWFLSTEKALFEARYKTAADAAKKAVHKQLCGGGYADYKVLNKLDVMNDENLNGKFPIPRFSQSTTRDRESEMLPFYKVPFAEVISLVGRRGVFVQDGYAFVPNNRFFTLITGKFRAHLNRGLVAAQKAMDKMRADPVAMNVVSRVLHIIDGLHKMTTGPSYKIAKNKSAISHKNVYKLSPLHFPLCMQSSMEHMKADGHLKHGGRMHLGLFLKGIGLNLSEAMIFWRQSFHKVGGDKFNKQYAYNVRHNYGKEGKRIDYDPYSCSKIVACTPGGGDYHGCPFKVWDAQNLKKYLLVHKQLSSMDAEQVLELVRNSHYQLACRSYFAVQHRDVMKKKHVTIDDIQSQWSHPNEYFDQSYKLYHGEQKTEEKDKENHDMAGNMTQTQGGYSQSQGQSQTQGYHGQSQSQGYSSQGFTQGYTQQTQGRGGMEVDGQ